MKRINPEASNLVLPEITRLLAGERRPHARKRLFALRMVFKGATVARAAEAAAVPKAAVEAWLRLTRAGRLGAVLEKLPRSMLNKRAVPAGEAVRLRAAIEVALRSGVNHRLAKRLRIVGRLLVEGDPDGIAREEHITRDTLRRWFSATRTNGPCGLILKADYRTPLRFDLDPKRLRTLTDLEPDPRIARRLLALTFIADGQDLARAAAQADVSRVALQDWVHRFQRGGVDGLHDAPLNKRDGKRELAAFIRRHKGSGFDALFKAVRLRFGNQYSRRYVRSLARDGLADLEVRKLVRFRLP